MSSNQTSATPSVSVVNAIAAVKGVPPASLDPLVRYVDLESLDDLVENSADEVQITCLIDGIEVVIEADGHASVSLETTDRGDGTTGAVGTGDSKKGTSNAGR
jgi:hypothetical protein